MQIIIDGLLTNYQVFGKKGDIILILPGWQRTTLEWQSCASELAKNNRVFLLDLPGFGITSRPKLDWDIFDYAEFVKKFFAKIQIKSSIIIGHSFGGRIGIVLASQNFPIKQLILVDSAGIERKNLILKSKIIVAKVFKFILPKKVIFQLLSGDYAEAGEMRAIFKKVVNQNLVSILPKIKIPTTIIWGEMDHVLPMAHAKLLHKLINQSRLRIVWGARHDPHLEKPEQFMEILTDTLCHSADLNKF